MRVRMLSLLSTACVLLSLVGAHAQAPTPVSSKTHTVVLIVSDGLRWQEIFSGADPTLMNEKNGGIWDKEADLRREFWRATPEERRKALFPFLWTKVAVQGQIFGNQTKGSIARVTNGMAFSYPGYNEMLTGYADKRIDSNEYGPNPNRTVFEWLNEQPELRGQVSVYATWSTFKDIFNVARSHLPLQVGWDLPYAGQLTPREALLNRLYASTTKLDDEDVYDSFLEIPLLDSFGRGETRVLFVGFGETDNWAHAGRYDLVLHSAHEFDRRSKSFGTACRRDRPTTTRRRSSSPRIMAAAAVRSIGKSTASSSLARKTSGSQCSARTPPRSASAPTLQRSPSRRSRPRSPPLWGKTTCARCRQQPRRLKRFSPKAHRRDRVIVGDRFTEANENSEMAGVGSRATMPHESRWPQQ
jgi:hypothetical protein